MERTEFPRTVGLVRPFDEDWFMKLERTRDRLMNVADEDLEPMNDADGEPSSTAP